MQYQSQKDRVISESIQEKKRKGGLVITELKDFSKTKKSKQETQKSQQTKNG